MKKILLVLALSLAVTGSYAQKGDWYIGTSNLGLGYNTMEIGSPVTGIIYDKNGDTKTTLWGLAPEVGYFVSDRVAIGLGLFYNHQTVKLDGVKEKTSVFGFNPYVRYHICASNRLTFYLQGGFDLASLDPDEGSSSTYWGVGINPGVAYRMSDKFTLTAAFGYLGYQDFDDDHTRFGLDLDMSTLKLGLNFKF